MSQIREGQKVSYIGTPDMVDIGDVGTVMEAGRNGSHVRWDTGARKGHIALVANHDLVVGTVADRSVTVDNVSLVTFSVRDAYEEAGETGVLKAMAKQGCFEPKAIGTEIRQMVASRLRSDPVFAEVLAALGHNEANDTLETACVLALREALRG